MIDNLKPLIVVLTLSVLLFAVAKPICLRFSSAEAFFRRRNVWLGLTAVAFLSPSFWFYALVAVPLLYWTGKKDPNPAAVYLLMLHVVPPMGINIPTALIQNLFELSNYRILALVVLLPAVIRLAVQGQGLQWKRFWVADGFVLAFALLQLVLLLPYESVTNTMRRAFLYTIDILLVYLLFSRMGGDRKRVADVLAAFVLACALMSVVAIFEAARGWLMYTGINQLWGDPNLFAWLLRSGDLRAQASSGHALALGYMLSMAFGFWLYLQRQVASSYVRVAVASLLIVGLYVTISRAPWLIAVAVYLLFYLISARPESTHLGRLSSFALVLLIFLMSPLGQPIVDRLPFVGTVGTDSVEYRQQLLATSWQLIQQNPFFGSPFVLTQMESLRQGQGIIDLVNVYASTAMFYGLVGLALFLAPFVIGTIGTILWARRASTTDPESARLGAALGACMIGTLLMLGAGSFGTVLPVLYWMLSGLGVEIATRHIGRKTQVTSAKFQSGRASETLRR